MSAKNITFILHKPQLSENIGACARGMKNFNFTKMIVVDPKPIIPNDKILATSVGAKNIILSAKVFKSVEESVGDLDIVFASTSRPRKINKKIISIIDFTKKIKKNMKVGIVFGPEASGLSNNEVNCADYLVTIPTNEDFSSSLYSFFTSSSFFVRILSSPFSCNVFSF